MFPAHNVGSSYSHPYFLLRTFPTIPKTTTPRLISPEAIEARLESRPLSRTSLEWTTSPDKPFLTKEEMRERRTMLKHDHKPYTMDLTIMVGKKKVHKSAVVRARIRRRFKEAVRMVVVRGARKPTKDEPAGLAFDQALEGPSHWLLRGQFNLIKLYE